MQTISFPILTYWRKRRKSCLRYHQEEFCNQQRHVFISANRYQLRWLGTCKPCLGLFWHYCSKDKSDSKIFSQLYRSWLQGDLGGISTIFDATFRMRDGGAVLLGTIFQITRNRQNTRAAEYRGFCGRNWTWNGTFDKSGESQRWLGINRRQLQCQ